MSRRLVEGGQGRSPRSVREDSGAVMFSLLAAFAVAISLVAKGCVA